MELNRHLSNREFDINLIANLKTTSFRLNDYVETGGDTVATFNSMTFLNNQLFTGIQSNFDTNFLKYNQKSIINLLISINGRERV